MGIGLRGRGVATRLFETGNTPSEYPVRFRILKFDTI